MKLRHHILIAVGAVATIVCLCAETETAAQGFGPPPIPPVYSQPPFMAPGARSLYYGAFYFTAGVRYRNIQTFAVSRDYTVTNSGTQGTPPFGPDDGIPVGGVNFGTPIPFGTGTGIVNSPNAFPLNPDYNPAGDPRTSGIWHYQNGTVSALDTGNTIGATCTNTTPPPPTRNCDGLTQAWVKTYPNTLMGRQVVTDGTAADCCATTQVTLMTGFFGFNDPVSQTDNPTSIAGTTRISWQWIIDGTYNATFGATSNEVESQISVIPRPSFGPVTFADKVWCPSFEAGFQYSSFFDVFTGFSFYNTSNTVTTSLLFPGQVGRRAFIDTFPFSSVQASAWPIATFSSDSTVIGDSGLVNYFLSPDGELNGLFPTRTFFFAPLPGSAAENMQEVLTQRADMNVVEFRFGGRSWIPLYGLGRFGVFIGTLASLVSYQVSGSEFVTSLGPSFPGQLLYGAMGNKNDSAWSFGGFAGTDVEVGVGRWLLKGSVEYSAAQEVSILLMSTETNFKPSGFQAVFSGGVVF